MNKLIKLINETLNEYFLTENDDIYYDYFEIHDDIYRDILSKMVKSDTKKIILKKIKPSMYQQALNEFMKFGEIVRYPSKFIYDWKNIIVRNTAYLDVITEFWGHSNDFDVDTVHDYVDAENINDWNDFMDYINEKGYDKILDEFLPKFSNGHDLISDFGLEPLLKIVYKLLETDDVNEIIVLVNKALDISHQRSDLSELFIEGGQSALNKISGLNENFN
jgi:hypothetical protein